MFENPIFLEIFEKFTLFLNIQKSPKIFSKITKNAKNLPKITLFPMSQKRGLAIFPKISQLRNKQTHQNTRVQVQSTITNTVQLFKHNWFKKRT